MNCICCFVGPLSAISCQYLPMSLKTFVGICFLSRVVYSKFK
jgi:hypothetical protein